MLGRRAVGVFAAAVMSLGAVAFVPARAGLPAEAVALPGLVATTGPDGRLSVDGGWDTRALMSSFDPGLGAAGLLDVTRADLAHASAVLNVAVGPPGDFNGDGLDDVVVERGGNEVSLAALDGLTGAQLWGRAPVAIEDGLAFPVHDVTGDGRTDLFRLWNDVLSQTSETLPCDEANCTAQRSVDEFRFTYAVVSGADGADLWERSVDGRVTYTQRRWTTTEGLTTTEWESADLEVVNGFVLLGAGRDYDGDSADDVVVNVVSETFSYVESDARTAVVFRDRRFSPEGTATTNAAVVDGATGASIHVLDAVNRPGPSVLRPAPDMVGDQAPDLLWDEIETTWSDLECQSTDVVVTSLDGCEPQTPVEERHVATLLDGSTLAPAWTNRSGVLDGVGVSPMTDVTGDGVVEVARVFASVDSPFFEATTEFIDGRTGQSLWQGAGFPFAAGADLGGDDRTDVLLCVIDWNVPDSVFTITLDRRTGADGGALFATTTVLDPPVEGSRFEFRVTPVDDAGGTSAPDVLMLLGRSEWAEDAPAATRTVIEDGRGQVLASREDPELRSVEVLPDLDGDGLNDGAGRTSEYDEPYIYWSPPRLHRLLDDVTLWTAAVEGDWVAPGEHDGTPGSELVLRRTADGGDSVSSVEGHTGEVRWTAS